LPAQFVMFAMATVALDAIATTSYGLGGAALAARMADPGFRRGSGGGGRGAGRGRTDRQSAVVAVSSTACLLTTY
jgi:hypothetical protein